MPIEVVPIDCVRARDVFIACLSAVESKLAGQRYTIPQALACLDSIEADDPVIIRIIKDNHLGWLARLPDDYSIKRVSESIASQIMGCWLPPAPDVQPRNGINHIQQLSVQGEQIMADETTAANKGEEQETPLPITSARDDSQQTLNTSLGEALDRALDGAGADDKGDQGQSLRPPTSQPLELSKLNLGPESDDEADDAANQKKEPPRPSPVVEVVGTVHPLLATSVVKIFLVTEGSDDGYLCFAAISSLGRFATRNPANKTDAVFAKPGDTLRFELADSPAFNAVVFGESRATISEEGKAIVKEADWSLNYNNLLPLVMNQALAQARKITSLERSLDKADPDPKIIQDLLGRIKAIEDNGHDRDNDNGVVKSLSNAVDRMTNDIEGLKSSKLANEQILPTFQAALKALKPDSKEAKELGGLFFSLIKGHLPETSAASAESFWSRKLSWQEMLAVGIVVILVSLLFFI